MQYNVSELFVEAFHTTIEFRRELPCWCSTVVHQYSSQKSTRTSGVQFVMKVLTHVLFADETRRSVSVHWVAFGTCYSKQKGLSWVVS